VNIETQKDSLLCPGENCWRVEHAARAAFLVDGADYFRAVRAAAARAQRSILILAWDVDSRMELEPEGPDDGLPRPLGEFLNALVRRTRGLHVHVLNWDFSVIFAVDREFLPEYKECWRTHRRVHYRLDAEHPIGGSHHQKIVVIDDAIAFVGGFDLTRARWDTPEHRAEDPHRTNPDGSPSLPFHDVQMAVDGAAAARIGELARERWRRATGKTLRRRTRRETGDPWPPSLKPDIEDVKIGIARTEPGFGAYQQVSEIKRLHLDMIAAARHRLYLENQYFSATSISAALAERLAEPAGPEVVLVGRLNEEGWLEASTMGVLRGRFHQRLREAEPGDRYGIFFPRLANPDGPSLNVHSKLMIADDELLTIGSANISNRSMGMDTECNLVLEARGETRVQAAIAALRHRLVAEHLGVAPGALAEQESSTGSLLATIKALQCEGRTLAPLDPAIPEGTDDWVPGEKLIDPELPLDTLELAARLVPLEARGLFTGGGLKRIGLVSGLLSLLGLLAAAVGRLFRWRRADGGPG
jgi:phospholipase D1/2